MKTSKVKSYQICIFLFFIFYAVPLLLFAQNPKSHKINYKAFSTSTVSNISKINTKHLEFAPNIFGDGIVFIASLDKGEHYDRNINESFFVLKYFDLELGVKPVLFSENLSFDFHIGPVTFFPDGKQLFFSQKYFRRRGL